MGRYIVYTEDHNNGKMYRWYYGVYPDKATADDVAYELGDCDDNEGGWMWHCICPEEEGESMQINNLYDLGVWVSDDGSVDLSKYRKE